MNGSCTGTVLTYNRGKPTEYDLVVSIDGDVLQLILANGEATSRFFLRLEAAADVARLIQEYLASNPPPEGDVVPFSGLGRWKRPVAAKASV